MRVVPSDSSGIAYIAFVNAQSSDVREVSTTEEVTAFLEGERVTASPGEGGDAEARTPTLLVERVAPNGTVVETLEVHGDETVRVVPANESDASNAAASG